jgi:dipeptidyl aminopeptidase/acylaminoacyl peptidase
MAVLTIVLTWSGIASGYSLVQYLNIQSASRPSVDNRSLEMAYITNITGTPQVWRMPVMGGYQTQVTFDTNGVSGVWLSPRDPDIMVLSSAVGGNERTQLYLANPSGGEWKRITKDDQAIYSFGTWARDGSRFSFATNTRNKKDFDLYEYNADEKAAFLLYQGEGPNRAADISPDNRYVLMVREYSAANTDIFIYDREVGKTRLLTPHEGDVVYQSPIWNNDSKGFFFLTNQDREYNGLAYWSLDSAAFGWVITPEADVEQFALSNDGSFLSWTVNDNGFSRFYFRNLRRGGDTGPTRLPDGVIQGMKFSPDNSKLFFTFGSATHPFDVWMYETGSDRMHELTFSALGGLAKSALLNPELIEYESFDGRKIPAFWYAPLGVKGKYPVIVAAHGGPEGQARPDVSPLLQYYLSRGYGVLEPNVRGSTGYGKSYMALDNVRKRMDSVKDYEYAARWLKSKPEVDSTRLIIYGGSYGGFIALSCLTTYPETWAAGASVVGISNFVTFLKNTGIYRRAQREAEYGSLAADSAFLAEISPVNHADKLKAPLFIIQGANDPRVPKEEAEQMAAAIKAKGGVVQYLLFDDEGHGLSKTKNKITAYSAMVDFLDQHLKTK